MIKNFFHNLNQFGVRYLLMSGQATVLYGAATFSEDIDIWVSPESENWSRFIESLRKSNAKIYKLTPPIIPEFIGKGHGFHFEFSEYKDEPVWFLDVMGIVPRVESFEKSYKNIKKYNTAWGIIPVIGLRDLVEIKKTRRLQDYPVISNLVRIEYENLSKKKIKNSDWKWILSNSFEIEDILYYLKNNRDAVKISETLSRKCLLYCLKSIQNQNKEKNYFSLASKEIAIEIESLREKDRVYWQKIINDLKYLGRNNKLLHTGDTPLTFPPRVFLS